MPRPFRSSKPLAVWLRSARDARGMSVRALAERAGISHPRISQIEGGDSATRDMVERLATALSPGDEDSYTSQQLLNAGLKAAGFATNEAIYPVQHGDIVRTLIREKRFDDQQFSGEEIEQIATGVASLIGGYIADKREARGEIN